MAREEVRTDFTANASNLLQAYQQMREAERATRQERLETARAAREAHREEQDNLRTAAQMTRDVISPLERYRERVQAVEKAYEQGNIDQETYNRQLKKQREELDEASRANAGWLDTMGPLIPTLGTLSAAVTRAWQDQARLREEVEATSLAMDDLTRKYQIQAGLTALQAGEARQAILKTALGNATDQETAFAAATQLVSSGFQRPEQTGVLDAFLKITASSNLAAENPQELAQGMGQFLQAFGMEKNAANLLDLGVRGRGLFTETDVQVADMSQFAKAAPVLSSAGLSMEESLSGLAILRETMQASEAATQMRNVVSTLATAGSDKGKADVLKSMGLKPGQLDFVGENESLPEVLSVLQRGLQSLPEEQRTPAIAKLFGRESAAGALTLLGNVDKFETFAELQNDHEGFAAGVNVSQSGPNAALRRAEVKQTMLELREEREAVRRAVAGKILDNEQLENYQASGFVGDVALGTANAITESAVWAGADPETFLSPEGRREVQSFGESNFSVEQLTEAIRENTNEMRNQKNGNPQRVEVVAQPEPPVPAIIESPAAALSN